MKRMLSGIIGAVSLLIFLFLWGVTDHMTSSLEDQNMAERWSKTGGVAQVSCFFSADASVTGDTLEEFEYHMTNYLKESAVAPQTKNPGARLWISAYSGEGKVTLSGTGGSLEADAIGVGGDFFLFHPMKLLGGSYFSGNDVNQDYCVIDEDAAWQLFGSSDVAGMMVTIQGVPHVISGVIERPKGKLYEAAGLDATRVYVSYSSLETYGSCHGINHYEIVMPNPVSKFAYNYVKEKLGANERETLVLENSSRFSLLRRLQVIGSLGTRSMNGKSIVYPFWENVARGYEDICGLLTLCMCLALVYPVTALVVAVVRLRKRKGWTFRYFWIKIVCGAKTVFRKICTIKH